jgi:hypothetical protein
MLTLRGGSVPAGGVSLQVLIWPLERHTAIRLLQHRQPASSSSSSSRQSLGVTSLLDDWGLILLLWPLFLFFFGLDVLLGAFCTFLRFNHFIR